MAFAGLACAADVGFFGEPLVALVLFWPGDDEGLACILLDVGLLVEVDRLPPAVPLDLFFGVNLRMMVVSVRIKFCYFLCFRFSQRMSGGLKIPSKKALMVCVPMH